MKAFGGVAAVTARADVADSPISSTCQTKLGLGCKAVERGELCGQEGARCVVLFLPWGGVRIPQGESELGGPRWAGTLGGRLWCALVLEQCC